MIDEYKQIAELPESTIEAKYESQVQKSDAFQTEAMLEHEFIKMLGEQGYPYVDIHSKDEVIANLRIQLEKLNDYHFSDDEWKRFLNDNILKSTEGKGIEEKTERIQTDKYIQVFTTDEGLTKNIKLIDKTNIHKNSTQVINQYVANEGTHKNRYDVTILVNGFPLVHVELKARGIPIKEAFNQIERYQKESFWSESGLFEYVQIFVISNGTSTKYYSNTTRFSHVEDKRTGLVKANKSSNSFEFTSYWSDGENKRIEDLVDFTKTFFARHSLLNILTKFCVFTTDRNLMVMRPYQIAATERILNRIIISTNQKQTGTIKAGGYIWHTTGSGKTLTSFKTAQLATNLKGVDKVLFVVDRKDLDYQTIKEYESFQKGCANGNRNTNVLKRQLENIDENGMYKDYKIIVTTIQKLSNFVKKNATHDIYKKHIVIIFDECHRSQFGEMHKDITKKFKNYHIFGFTGTPIFPENANSAANKAFSTTEQVFGDQLHSYTIVDAIRDGNVLRFRIDYINTVKNADSENDEKNVKAINTDEVLLAQERVQSVVSYVLDHFDQKTLRNISYKHKSRHLNGFNSIFAASSIEAAKKYYYEFKRQIEERNCGLQIATIFSFAANEEEANGLLSEEEFETDDLDKTSKEFLDSAVADYNKMFRTNFSIDSKGFQDYYKDLSKRVKDREVDILIVVNMFLTGFDAKMLNTLWVDKNLKQHGLIQAYSRTNRILNSIKSYGNIICFRDLSKETDDALSMFGDREKGGIVRLRTFLEYMKGFTDDNGKQSKGYEELVSELYEKFPVSQTIESEKSQKEFIMLMGAILRARNILSSFDEFAENDTLNVSDLQNYMSKYHDIHDSLPKDPAERDSILKDVVFEMELIKHIEVNIDYILMLVAEYKKNHDGESDKEILIKIRNSIESSGALRSRKDLIEDFISRLNTADDVDGRWRKYVMEAYEKELDSLIANLKLKPEEAKAFMKTSIESGTVNTFGTDLEKILPPVRRFGGGNRAEVKNNVVQALLLFHNKYCGIVSFGDEEQTA